MAYKSYLTKRYDHTHENTFFRAFSAQLRRTFLEVEGLNVLIGNVSCNGHQIDALFLSRGKIIVIDFKNYGGTLTFSENNPWQISKENDFVFVKGGGGIRNPYQQVNAYRHSLMQFLDTRQQQFLTPNHENFNLGHLSTLVLFQQPILFNNGVIPQILQRYFFVADNNTCISTIRDINSVQLNLSDIEIDGILSVLDIREDNLYNEIQEPEVPQDTAIPNAAERLEQVRKELSKIDFADKSDMQKLLLYYQTLLSLERVKEPTVNDAHPFHVNWRLIIDSILINIENSPEFHVRFQQNQHLQFPKNLFIGINFLLNSQNVPLLHNVISSRDILGHTAIESPISDFTLYSKPLEDRNYPEELIEELASAINSKKTIIEKIEVLRTFLGGVVELVENITLAFSEENPFTSQLLSEIKKINQENLVLPNSLLDCFLRKTAVADITSHADLSEFIQITPLNAGQKDAVKSSFSQTLTVITGPPGTGKTQVVLNILANAIVRNKKVLLASKNNQAVDNVKERLSGLIKEPNFFLRFGSKTEIRDKTIPSIYSYVTRIHNHLIPDNTERLSEVNNLLRNKKAIIANAKAAIERKMKIESALPALQDIVSNNERNFQIWKDTNMVQIAIFCNHSRESLNTLITQNNFVKNKIVSKYSGFGKILFDLLSRKKYAIILASAFESLPTDLRQLAISNGLNINLPNLKNGGEILSAYANLTGFIESGIIIQDKLKNFDKNIVESKNNLDQNLQEKENLQMDEPNLITLISQNFKEIAELGIPLLNESIHKKIRNGDAAQINNFKDYVPDNIPWRTNEIPSFVETTKKFLDTFNISAITSLSIKSAFPLAEGLFDMVVIDEASQCDIASALPLILRAKQLVVIGDPMQLKHISKVQPYEESYIVNTLGLNANLRLDYVNESLFEYCYNLSITSKSRSVFLKEHFRCHPDIIGYSNRAFYGPIMGQELDILTNPINYQLEPRGIFWIDSIGDQDSRRNSNQLELKKAIDLACRLAAQHPGATIGITTPFAHQAKDLKEAIPQNLQVRIKADTVHRFQGDEKDIMIISLVVTENSPQYKAEWINRKVPYLINVAVTRAKNTLYIIGNVRYCRTLPADSALGRLVRYVDGINPIN